MAQNNNAETETKEDAKAGIVAVSSNPKMKWYVIQAFSGYEQRVADTLRLEIKNQGMQDFFGEVLVPKEKVRDMKEGKKVESERKFFPGYVLIQMVMNEKTWLMVRHTDRVLGFVGGSVNKPMPITDATTIRSASKYLRFFFFLISKAVRMAVTMSNSHPH